MRFIKIKSVIFKLKNISRIQISKYTTFKWKLDGEGGQGFKCRIYIFFVGSYHIPHTNNQNI